LPTVKHVNFRVLAKETRTVIIITKSKIKDIQGHSRTSGHPADITRLELFVEFTITVVLN